MGSRWPSEVGNAAATSADMKEVTSSLGGSSVASSVAGSIHAVTNGMRRRCWSNGWNFVPGRDVVRRNSPAPSSFPSGEHSIIFHENHSAVEAEHIVPFSSPLMNSQDFPLRVALTCPK